MIKKMKREDFDRVYDIMEQSFPSDEIRPYDEQKNLLETPAYSLYITEQKNAFIGVWEFDCFVFIEHFAVSCKCRNTGLGGKILSEFLGKQKKTVCLEVELPITDISKRRIGFYERNGFFLNEYDYFQPPISKGKNIVPLMIMTSKSKVSEKDFYVIRDTLYKEVYDYNIKEK
ncbi:MAG: GNAT family N-acetyltransferase [Clostridia bacterium]|nr:GNAT family N-acetyltransferase [Clostridia bacterium]